MKNFKQWIYGIVGCLLVLDGLFIMAGWWAHSKSLIMLFGWSPPVAFNSGVAFLLLGLAFLWILRGRQMFFPRLLGMIVCLSSLTYLLEYIFDLDLYIDQIFLSQDSIETSFPGRPAPLSCVGYVAIGFAIALYSNRIRGWIRVLISILGWISFWSALLGIINYVQPIDVGLGLLDFDSPSVQASLGLLLCAIGTLTLSFEDTWRENISWAKWLPFTVGGTFVIFIFYLYHGLITENIATVRSLVDHESFMLQMNIKDHLQDHINATNRLAARLKRHGMQFDQAWEEDTENYIRDTVEYRAIGWVNDQLTVKHIVPPSPQSLLNTSISIDDSSLIKASKEGSVPFIIEMDEQLKQILLFVPVFEANQFLGGLFALLDADQFFKETFFHTLDLNYQVKVEYAGTSVYKIGNPEHLIVSQQKEIVLGNFKLNLIVGLSKAEEHQLLNLGMVYLIFGGGIVLSIVLGALVYFWQANIFKLRELHKIKQRLDYAISAASQGIWDWQVEEDRFFCDESTSKLLQLEKRPFDGKFNDFIQAVQLQDKEVFLKSIREAAENLSNFQAEARIVYPDGSTHFLEFKGNAQKAPDDGNQVEIGGVCWDITERKKLERIKDEFISIVSHELRTPLTAIKGALGLILGRPPAEMVKDLPQLLGLAYANTQRLERIVDDILDIQKIQKGHFELVLSPVDLKKVIEDSIVMNIPMAEKHKITLIADHLIDHIQVKGDAGRLVQVMNNLLTNAIKFSYEGGKVFVTMERLPSSVRVSVKDEGQGIPENAQSKIFEKFVQADSSSTRAAQGTGLGLAIVKNIIEKHGGKISFISKKGIGTTFFFELPLL